MAQIGLWHITQDTPEKLKQGRIDLETHLETWIERDPALLQAGLTIVGRQMTVEGGKLDLLALDPQARWVVVEIKSETVRRETVAQALDYASCIATMPYEELEQKVDSYLKQRLGSGTTLKTLLEERQGGADVSPEDRDVLMFVVGTGRALGLERMVRYMSRKYGMPISVVSYQVFATAHDQQILARELDDWEIEPSITSQRPSRTVEDICGLADRSGIGQDFRTILAAAQRFDLYPRPYSESIMYTPPSNRTRALFTVRARPRSDGLLRVYVETTAFAEFYPVAEELALEILGQAGWRIMPTADVEAFVADLAKLFATIEPRK